MSEDFSKLNLSETIAERLDEEYACECVGFCGTIEPIAVCAHL